MAHLDVTDDDVISPIAPEAQSEEAQPKGHDEVVSMPFASIGVSTVFNHVTPY